MLLKLPGRVALLTVSRIDTSRIYILYRAFGTIRKYSRPTVFISMLSYKVFMVIIPELNEALSYYTIDVKKTLTQRIKSVNKRVFIKKIKNVKKL